MGVLCFVLCFAILCFAAFMNTQLFFNPVNPQQKDFWHRDCQYDYDLEDQMKVILETQVLHLRVPLFDELGMEIIPGTQIGRAHV